VITKVKPRKPSEFQSVLLAIAGHDPRQPLQVIQGAHEFLGRGVRTTPERRQLRSGQSVIDRSRDQLNELVAVIQFRAHPKGVKLTPVRGGLGRAFAVALGRDVRMDLVARDAS
jgi:two-component system phosphate regulon sensor histidine kinase PhoR